MPEGEPEGVSFLTLLLEADRPQALSARLLLSQVHHLEIGRGLNRAFSHQRLEVPDKKISFKHAQIVESMGRYILEDLGSKNGTFLNGIAKRRAALVPGDVIRMGRSVFVFHTVYPRVQPSPWVDFEGQAPELSSVLPELDAAFDSLRRLPQARVPVCLVAGREREPLQIARSIHRHSQREGCFELFEEGNKIQASTTYVDQLKNLNPEHQKRLLVQIQEQHSQVIVATDIELEACTPWVRADLLAALSARVLRLPPLAARREDIGLMMGTLAVEGALLSLTAELIEYCYRCEWPLDVAQLRSVLIAAAQLSPGDALQPSHLAASMRPMRAHASSRVLKSLDAKQANHREELVRLLEVHKGNISAVARELGKARTQVQRWMRRYEIIVP